MDDLYIWHNISNAPLYNKTIRNIEETMRMCSRSHFLRETEKEYIFLHLGGCGIRVGDELWKNILLNDKDKNMGVMFNRHFDNTIKARGIFVDNDFSSFENLDKNIYDKNNFVCEKDGGEKIEIFWVFLIFLGKIKEKVEEVVRKLLEETHFTNGFFMSNALGGFTSSEILKDILSDLRLTRKDTLCFSIIPNNYYSNILQGLR